MSYTNGLDKPDLYFNTKLYTGTEVSGNSITGVGFQPDFIWIKNRSDATNHNLYDSVRGGNGTSHYWLKSNATVAEGTNTSSLLTIDSDGFTLGDGNEVNGTPDNIVSWNWLASNTTASNTVGDIASTVSANTTSGFSIVSYTGTGANATVGHGLGVAPKMIITKARGTTNNWGTYHESLGNTDAIFLNLTNATDTFSGYWNNTSPTSSVFSVGSALGTNPSATMIAYCFAEKKGFSKFGSYTGNGNADGTFVYTGFKPAFVITKRTDGVVDWYMFDNKRQNPFNVINGMLRPSATSTELDESSVYLDFLSNGFKWKGGNAGNNASGGTYIYMAFAENPFVTSTGIPTTAR
jgi:hypothetical protein